MRILYLHNFRGFQSTFIPIMDVNFFIGENSTGKSSILSLLRLMASSHFWVTDDFNSSDIELGSFEELITQNIKGKKECRIGYYTNEREEEEDDQKQRVFRSVLATYKNSNGSPKLSKLKLIVGKTSINIQVSDRTFKFYFKRVNYKVESLKTFKAWIVGKVYIPED